MARSVLLLTLLLTAADAVGASRFAVCRMRMAEATEKSGCGHCPPAAAPTLRDGLPDCCALHTAARPMPAPSEEAARPTRHGPTLAVLLVPAVAAVSVAMRAPSPRLLTRSTAPPSARNLPLLR